MLFLSERLFARDVGWRLSFATGALLGLAILIVRRNVPESARWLFIQGREHEAERIVGGLERDSVKRDLASSAPGDGVPAGSRRRS